MRSIARRCETLYAEALAAGEALEYSRAIKLLDEAIDLIAERQGSAAHWTLAKYYLKIARCMYMGVTVPGGLYFPEDEEGEEGEGEDEGEGEAEGAGEESGESGAGGSGGSIAPSETGGASEAGSASDASGPQGPAGPDGSEGPEGSDGPEDSEDSENPRTPFVIISEYLDKALGAIANTPARKRSSREVLAVEAETYYVYGMLEIKFNEGDPLSSLKSALAIYLELGPDYAFQVGECRYFLGRAHLRLEQYEEAAVEFLASSTQLQADEEALRVQIRALKAKIASAKAARFVLLKERRRKATHVLKLRRNALLERLAATKFQRRSVEALEQRCLAILEPSESECSGCSCGACGDDSSDYSEPELKRLPEGAGDAGDAEPTGDAESEGGDASEGAIARVPAKPAAGTAGGAAGDADEETEGRPSAE